jgi:hypothetical protein
MTWLTTSRRRDNFKYNLRAGGGVLFPVCRASKSPQVATLSSGHTSQGLNRSFPGVVSWNIRSGPSSLAVTVTGAPRGASL